MDLGGVYFTSATPTLVNEVAQIVSAPKQRVKEIFSCSGGKEGLAYRQGKYARDQFWDLACAELGIKKELVHHLEHLWFDAYVAKPAMQELVRNLRKHYKVIVFSGNFKARIDYLNKEYHLKNEFDDFLYSFDAGCSKGDSHFYEHLVKKLEHHHVKPEESLFIDDHQKFLDKAKPFGIKTLLFETPEKLEKDLKAMGVKC